MDTGFLLSNGLWSNDMKSIGWLLELFFDFYTSFRFGDISGESVLSFNGCDL